MIADDLPDVPPLPANHQCRLCGRWLEGEWNRARDDEALRHELHRQILAGRCDDCTRLEAVRLGIGVPSETSPQ
jgi:hypothetical protein